jgi:hypothetical protein
VQRVKKVNRETVEEREGAWTWLCALAGRVSRGEIGQCTMVKDWEKSVGFEAGKDADGGGGHLHGNRGEDLYWLCSQSNVFDFTAVVG